MIPAPPVIFIHQRDASLDAHLCREFMDGFSSPAASVADMQLYAKCVHLLYPGNLLQMKIAVIFIAACCVAGGIAGWTRDRTDPGYALLGAAMGMLFGMLTALACFLIDFVFN